MIKLTQKQETFCLKYFELGNATEAAIVAGYSPKTVRAIASENLTKPDIIHRIEELRKAAEDKTVASVLERKQRLTEILRANVIDFVDEEGNISLEAEHKGALAELTVDEWKGGSEGRAVSRTKRVKLHSPLQAADLLNKMEKIYSDGAMVNVDNRQVNIYVGSDKAKDLTQRLIEGERTG